MATRPRANQRVPIRVGTFRRRLMLAGLLVLGGMIGLRSFQVSVLQHERWEARALAQHADRMQLPAPRGTIYDRDGMPLAASREVYRLAIAPREVVDRDALVKKLREHAGLTASQARRALSRDARWRVLPGRYDESVKEALDATAGVHFERVMQRFYPHGALAAELLGTVNAAGDALGGIELEFDALLRGEAGMSVVRHGPNGRPIPGMMLRTSEPVPGRDVYLTIDYELQAIADDALRDALDATGAAGGELLLLDPRTGEVLASASRRGRRAARNWSVATVPYEPGSILKPFTVAAVLAEGKGELTDSLHGENGRYPVHGRVITDVHPYGWLTLGDGLRFSSNIVVAKAAARLSAAQQYRYLRDFGFGSPTGVRYPSESGGLLRRVPEWSRQSAASLAIGYEVSVTPLQMAVAYAAIANGGVLMEPRLVREVRSRDGRVEQSFTPRPVRRVVPAEVAAQIQETLIGAVEVGTGRAAAMGPFKVAGKTGTARVAAGGRYVQGAYTATFAGFFPAVDPQLVFLVKVDRPRGAYYGGSTAAPVTRATLEAALAAHSTPLDRRAMARAPAPLPPLDAGAPAPERRQASELAEPELRSRVTLVSYGGRRADAPSSRVPDVSGLALRDAVRSLHAAGYRVEVRSGGRVRATAPRAGTALEPGGVVRLDGTKGSP